MAKKAPQSVQSDFFASALLVFAVAGLVVSSAAASVGVGKLAYDFQINLPQSSASAQVASVASANGTGLTDAQISAVLSLLSAFGAPQDTVTSVGAILRGENTDGSTPTGTATPPTAATTTPAPTSNPMMPLYCPDITRHLNRGTMGDDVAGLQKFLSQQGVLTSDNVTGVFGSTTQSALARWQLANGVVSAIDSDSGAGEVGSLTREAIAHLCDVPVPVTINDCPSGYTWLNNRCAPNTPAGVTIHDCAAGYVWHDNQCVVIASTTPPVPKAPSVTSPDSFGSTTSPGGTSGAGSSNSWFGR